MVQFFFTFRNVALVEIDNRCYFYECEKHARI